METDVLIVGGGATGLAAAYEAASVGLRVTIVEQSWSLGGHLREQVQALDDLPKKFYNRKGFEVVNLLVGQLDAYPIQTLINHTLIGRYKDGSFGVSDGRNVFPIKASKVIFATGAAEKSIVFPKWTLPGIMTAGAAQIFMNRERVKPGEEVIMVGSSDFAIEVCSLLDKLGVKIKGIVEKKDVLQAKKKKHLEWLTTLNIPVFLHAEIETAIGKDAVEKVIVKNLEKSIEIPVDLVCTAGGFHPVLEPFQMIGCALSHSEHLGGWLPDYDHHFMTSEENIYVAGDACGITCHGAIILSGALAGMNAAATLVGSTKLSQKKQDTWMEMKNMELAYNPIIWNGRQQHMNRHIGSVI